MSDVLRKAWAEGKFDNRRKLTADEMTYRGCTMKGKKHSQQTKDIITKKLSSTWKIQYPDGQVVITENLNQFYRDNNINQANMLKTLKRIIKQHKGFILLEKIQ